MRINPQNFTRIVYFVVLLGLTSAGIVWLLRRLLAFSLGDRSGWVSWIETPSVLAVMLVLYCVFDRVLWPWPIFCVLGLVEHPDLRGRWKGEVRSSYSGGTVVAAVLEIVQSSSSIYVFMYTADSHSVSQVADFTREPNDGVTLHYTYRNQPLPGAARSMEMHEGAAALLYHDDIDVLEGFYYTGRGRGTYGGLRFERAGRQVLRRFSD